MPRFYMVNPEHFRVSYSINPWMEPSSWTPADAEAAQLQWKYLKATLEHLGAEVLVAPGDPASPDLVFTANHAVVLDGKVFYARFKHPERSREDLSIRWFFNKHPHFNTFQAPLVIGDYHFEGAGDAVWDPHRRVIWFGHGQRSDEVMAEYLREFFNVPVIPLQLHDPRYYHLDTAFHVLPKGEIFYYPQAFAQKDQQKIHRLAGENFVLSPDDARAFSANAISWNDNVVMSDCGRYLWDALTKWGYRIHLVPLRAFHASGGSAYCLTNRLDNK